MSSESPLTKRIKRHVIGPSREFFVATAPGFEKLCLKELRSLVPNRLTASAVTGGVSFKGRLHDCYLANLNLRTANRILMRIDTVIATSFSQLQKNLLNIAWELFLRIDQVPQIHVSTRHCKLHHTGAISERTLRVIEDRKKSSVFMEPGETLPYLPQNIYVRGIDDCFTISIDSSGDHLHKRGLKKHPGKAPLRETIAAAALLLAGYKGDRPLMDPMCGTGTFSLEAALMAKKIPPGWFREFAFEGWPSFRQAQWNYLKRQYGKKFARPGTQSIFASDNDPRAAKRLKNCLKRHDLEDTVSVAQINFFYLSPGEFSDQKGLIALNPPYGRRMGTRDESERFFLSICDRLYQDYKGWNLILIAPNKPISNKITFKLKTYPLLHGGMKLKLMVGKIR
jgi:putative N6-adenine-specific DNA methylase